MELHLAPTGRAKLAQPLEFPFVVFVPGIKEAVLGRSTVKVPVPVGDRGITLQPIFHPAPRNIARRPSYLRLKVIDHAQEQVRRSIHAGPPSESSARSPQRDLNVK